MPPSELYNDLSEPWRHLTHLVTLNKYNIFHVTLTNAQCSLLCFVALDRFTNVLNDHFFGTPFVLYSLSRGLLKVHGKPSPCFSSPESKDFGLNFFLRQFGQTEPYKALPFLPRYTKNEPWLFEETVRETEPYVVLSIVSFDLGEGVFGGPSAMLTDLAVDLLALG